MGSAAPSDKKVAIITGSTVSPTTRMNNGPGCRMSMLTPYP